MLSEIMKQNLTKSSLYQYSLAIIFTLVALALSRLFWPVINDAPFLFFFGAVALSAWRGGLGPGMMSAAIAIVSADYFLIEPLYNIFTSPIDLLQFGIFSLIAFLIGWLEETRNQGKQDILRYAALVQNTNDAVISKSLEGVITSWNPGAEQIYGYRAEEAIGQPIEMLFPDDLKPIELQLLDRIAHGDRIEHYETKRLHKNGHEVDIELTISPIRQNNGEIKEYATIERDITERKQLTEQIEQERRKLYTILNTIPGVVYEGSGGTDAGTQNMDFISQHSEKMLGYSPEEWQQTPGLWEKIVHPEDWESAVSHANDTYESNVPGPVGFRCITKDGKVIHTESYNASIIDQTGKRVGTCGLIMDVTERKRREQEITRLTALIEAQRQRLDSIIRNLPGIVYDTTIDPENGSQIVNFISEYTQEMLGYSPENWREDPAFWEKVVEPEDLEVALKEATQALEEDRMGNSQFRCKHEDGNTVYAESYFNFVQEGTAVRQFGVIMDITERKATEQAIQDYTYELRRSNEELEQFAYVASHDLQEPLRMVTSYLQLIEKRYADQLDTDAHEFIDFAVDGASRMKTLINDLLAYSRVQRSKAEFKTVNMPSVLEQVQYNLQFSIEDSDAAITYDELPEIMANEQQMVQLLQNLISNAIKFRGDDPPQIHISVEKERQHWLFCVKDNGIGIDPAYQERIFVIFQRLHTRQDYEGTGIGLAICRKIVEKHDGDIWVESEPGDGTAFYFTIPITQRKRVITYASN